MQPNKESSARNPRAGASREARRPNGATGSFVKNGANRPPVKERGAEGPRGSAPPKRRGEGIGAENRREGSQRPPQRRHHRGSHILLYATGAIALGLLLYLIVRLALLIIPVREIAVTESDFFTAEEMIEAVGIGEGDRMFGFSVKEKEEHVLSKYPLLKSLRIRRSLSGKLTISAEEKDCKCYVKVSGCYYVLGWENFTVLLESDSDERLKEYGLYEISLPSVRTAFLGEALEFGKAGEGEYVGDLLETLESSFLKGRITGIRASSAYRISVIVDGKYDVVLGGMSDLERKLERLEIMMQSELFLGDAHVEVDLSVLSAPVAKRVERIDDKIS